MRRGEPRAKVVVALRAGRGKPKDILVNEIGIGEVGELHGHNGLAGC